MSVIWHLLAAVLIQVVIRRNFLIKYEVLIYLFSLHRKMFKHVKSITDDTTLLKWLLPIKKIIWFQRNLTCLDMSLSDVTHVLLHHLCCKFDESRIMCKDYDMWNNACTPSTVCYKQKCWFCTCLINWRDLLNNILRHVWYFIFVRFKLVLYLLAQ